MGLLAPIVLVAFELQNLALDPFDELVGARAGGLAAVVEVAFPVALGLVGNDVHVRQVDRHQGIGLRRLDAQRVVVDALIGLAAAMAEDLEAGLGVRVCGRTLHGENHVVDVEFRSVVELHALPQLEFPGRVVDRLPFRGQAGQQALLVVLFHQAGKDVLSDLIVRTQVVIVRVDRGRLRAEPDGDGLGLRGRAGGEGQAQARRRRDH